MPPLRGLPESAIIISNNYQKRRVIAGRLTPLLTAVGLKVREKR